MKNNNIRPEKDDIDGERSTLMHETSKDNNALRDIPLCGFLSVQYYQPYFDVDTSDIYTRIFQSTFYCRREQNFLALIGEKPDAYGPFWIATTLVFALAVASHLNVWFTAWIRGATMTYNFQSILSASSVIYSYAAFAPLCIWFVFKQYQPNLRFVPIVSLYGYSLFIYIPAVLLCLFPSQAMAWTALLVATVSSSVFLLRNLAPFVVSPDNGSNSSILLALVAIVPVSFMLCLKFNFFKNI